MKKINVLVALAMTLMAVNTFAIKVGLRGQKLDAGNNTAIITEKLNNVNLSTDVEVLSNAIDRGTLTIEQIETISKKVLEDTTYKSAAEEVLQLIVDQENYLASLPSSKTTDQVTAVKDLSSRLIGLLNSSNAADLNLIKLGKVAVAGQDFYKNGASETSYRNLDSVIREGTDAIPEGEDAVKAMKDCK